MSTNSISFSSTSSPLVSSSSAPASNRYLPFPPQILAQYTRQERPFTTLPPIERYFPQQPAATPSSLPSSASINPNQRACWYCDGPIQGRRSLCVSCSKYSAISNDNCFICDKTGTNFNTIRSRVQGQNLCGECFAVWRKATHCANCHARFSGAQVKKCIVNQPDRTAKIMCPLCK